MAQTEVTQTSQSWRRPRVCVSMLALVHVCWKALKKEKEKRTSRKFNKCFMRHATWKIPGKIRFMWPSEGESGRSDSVTESIMGLAQPAFISAHCKNIWRQRTGTLGQGSFLHTHVVTLEGRGVTCASGDCSDWYSLQREASALLLFSRSTFQTVTLSSVGTNYYGNEWNGYQMDFFLTPVAECWD